MDSPRNTRTRSRSNTAPSSSQLSPVVDVEKGKKRKSVDAKSEDENANEEKVKEVEDTQEEPGQPELEVENTSEKPDTSENTESEQSLGRGKRVRKPNNHLFFSTEDNSQTEENDEKSKTKSKGKKRGKTGDTEVLDSSSEAEGVSEAQSTESKETVDHTEEYDDKSKSKPKGKKRKATEMEHGESSSEAEPDNVISAEATDKVENVEEENDKAKHKGTKRKATEVLTVDSSSEAEPEAPNVEIKDKPPGNESDSTSNFSLGKGKRARIPNKRYSDISITTTISKPPKTAENGSDKIEPSPANADFIREESLSPSMVFFNKNLAGGDAKKRKVDISDPRFLKPFQRGWKRELVIRAPSPLNPKRMSDVYYFTPEGKKLRSLREVVENLATNSEQELTVDNFTFFKESLGGPPDSETVRDALRRSNTPIMQEKMMAAAVKAGKSPRSPAIQKNSSPKPEVADTSGKTKLSSKNLGSIKVKLPSKRDSKKLDPPQDEEMEVISTSSKATPAKKSGKGANYNKEDKPCQPCSITCEGVHGLVPTLQCRLCLCLYHHECVGLAPHLTASYICKNCQQEQKPPPLTPINTLKSASAQSASAATTTLPKLQRIPKPDDPHPIIHIDREPTPVSFPEMPRLSPYIDPPPIIPEPIVPPVVNEPQRSIVGSVTTWLPHNAKIVDMIPHSNEGPTTEVPRPQYVEFLAGRKFLVIPKHNFMSVSPNIAATAITRPNVISDAVATPMQIDSVSLGSNPNKPELGSPSKPENSQTSEALSADGAASEPMDVERKKEDAEPEKAEATPAPKKRAKLSNDTNPEEQQEEKSFYFQNLSYGYNALLYLFQYLKVQDLLSAGRVCIMWRDLANNPSLWHTVRMKNSQIHCFKGMTNALKKHGTYHLDLRKMLLPTGGDEIWPEFSREIEKVDSLRKIDLCRCPASVVEKLAESNPLLESIQALTIKCESMDLSSLKNLKQIKELRLKSTGGLTLTSDLDSLKELNTLVHLSLTSIRDLNKMNLDVIGELTNLETLDLGECTDLSETFSKTILVKLTKLEKLRLEKGQGDCHTFDVLETIKDMNSLEQLELINFDIKPGFDKALGACKYLKKLLVIPTYISQSATTNHMVLGGVLRLQKTLSHFVWGVTLELLRVTELFVDQCEDTDKKEKKKSNNGDSIPVLKPVPLLKYKGEEIPKAYDPPQVEILALPGLQKLLMQNLPTTRVKILKIPFHATWRQSLNDSIN